METWLTDNHVVTGSDSNQPHRIYPHAKQSRIVQPSPPEDSAHNTSLPQSRPSTRYANTPMSSHQLTNFLAYNATSSINPGPFANTIISVTAGGHVTVEDAGITCEVYQSLFNLISELRDMLQSRADERIVNPEQCSCQRVSCRTLLQGDICKLFKSHARQIVDHINQKPNVWTGKVCLGDSRQCSLVRD